MAEIFPLCLPFISEISGPKMDQKWPKVAFLAFWLFSAFLAFFLGLPPHPPLQRRPDPSAQVLLDTLCDNQIIFPVSQRPAAPVFARYKSELKARVILDLRAYNSLFPRPPPFHLPNLSSLLRSHQLQTHFFIKLDISNFFWSLTLPLGVTGMFTFAAGDTQPYGWRGPRLLPS